MVIHDGTCRTRVNRIGRCPSSRTLDFAIGAADWTHLNNEVTTMHTTLFLLALAFFGWRAVFRNRRPGVASRRPTLRNQIIGDEGEALVQAELRETLRWLCGDNFYLHPTALLLNHAPGTAHPTAEIDHLAITPLGLFVIETKNWTGSIEPGADPDTVIRTGVDGRAETRRSPLRQNQSKVGFLRSMLPKMWAIEGLGVFASDACVLSSSLPPGLIRRRDLGQWLRNRKTRHEAQGRRNVDVHQAWTAVQAISVADPGGDALARHRRLVSTNP